MKKFSEWVMVLLFSGTLLVLMAATILLPKERYSYYENRNLSAFPEISVESVASGKVFGELETMFCDYAAWRTAALRAVTWCDLNLFHRPVVNDSWKEDFQKVFGEDCTSCHYGTKFDDTAEGDFYALDRAVSYGKHFVFFASMQYLRRSKLVGGDNDEQLKADILSADWDLVAPDVIVPGDKSQGNFVIYVGFDESGKKK